MTDWPPGSGEMAGRIRRRDWVGTSLGAIEAWSDRLRLMVEQMLASPLVSTLVCGPDRLLVYNDEAARLYGGKHPSALGRPLPETFPEGWATVEPFYERAFAGESVTVLAQPLDTRGEGDPGGDVFDAYLTPVREADGRIAYVQMSGIEVGARVRAERHLRESEERQNFLLGLSDGLRTLVDPVEIKLAATRSLGERLDVNRAFYLETDGAYWLTAEGYEVGVEHVLGGPHPIAAYGPWMLDELRAGHRLSFGDVATDPRFDAPQRAAHEALQIAAALVAPLVKNGGLVAALVLQTARPHSWSDQEAALIEAVAERTWAAVERARAEAGLRESEERFRALVTAGAYMLYRMSPDWGQMWQPSGSGVLADMAEPMDDWAELFLLPEDRPTVFAAIEDAIRRRSLFELEHRVRRRDGRIAWVLSRAVPLLDGDGGIVAWFGVGSDITERKEAQEAVRQAEERHRADLERQVRERTAELTASRDLLQATMDSSMDMIQVFEAVRDASGAIVDFRWILNNHTSESRFGEVRGQSLLQRNPGVVQEGIFDAFRHVAETGEPAIAERHYTHEQFDGWFFQSAVKLGDGVATTTKEITAWKAAQAEVLRLQDEIARARLLESEERLRQFGEASSDVLWIREAETLQWVYLTPAFETIYGLARETALRDDNMVGWLDLIVPEDRQSALDGIRRVRAGERVAFEYRIRRPSDGALRWLRNTDFPMRDAAGRVCWLGGVGRDITAEKAAAQRQEVLVNELQHRARNLLGVVAAVAGRTLRQGGSIEGFEERLKALSRAQGLLSQHGSDTVAVGELVRAELAAHITIGSALVSVGGPDVHLTARQVQNFALALHELTTNAVKYGALKNGTGQLVVTWAVIPGRRRRRLALSWIESGVTVRPEATRRGYGTELIQEALAYALEAEVDYVLGEDGVRCRIEMPIP